MGMKNDAAFLEMNLAEFFFFFFQLNLYIYTHTHTHKYIYIFWASLVAQLVKKLPAMWETKVWSLDWEDPLETGKATHSSILAQRIPWTV